jgi:hypothetical protein
MANSVYAVPLADLPWRDHPAPAGWAGGVRHRNQHVIFPLNACKMTVNEVGPTPTDARTKLVGTPAALGNAIFLNFDNEQIYSVRLPCPAPAGVDLFYTANMSGCKFFVDTINGSNDLIVYHANTRQHSAGDLADTDVQSGQAVALLNTMHTNAQGDYAALQLANFRSCQKSRYFFAAGHAERTYHLQGMVNSDTRDVRTAPRFMGGATILGFPAAGTWEFWYQTWGDVYRQTPARVEKKPWHQKDVKHPAGPPHQVSYATLAVMRHAQILTFT